MRLSSSTSSRASTDAYRRQARRLRGRLASHSGELYAALQQLSHHADQPRHAEAPNAKATPQHRHEQFASLVLRRFDGPVLRYSARKDLIRHAQRSGIGRFEANLIIAAVQHRHLSRSPRPVIDPPLASPRLAKALRTLALAGTVQAILIAAAWCALFA